MVVLEAGHIAVTGYRHDFPICEASICPQGYGCHPNWVICVDKRKTGSRADIFHHC